MAPAMSPDVAPLFQPLVVKGHTLRNRLVMPPMVTNRFIGGPDGIAWYREHAAGVGLVIVEATSVNRFGRDLDRENLAALAAAIHDAGALAAIQLFPVDFGADMKPAGLAVEAIHGIVAKYRVAARLCADAGFDGVEPHGAHGFVLNQFFSPLENRRTDDYGGPPASRARLGLEIVQAAREGLGPDRLLLYRHTPVGEGYALDDSLAFAAALVPAGVDILDISPASDQLPADRAAPFRRFGVPVIAVNLMDEVERALAALREQRADLIAIGRGLIADPQWPQKVRAGRLDDIVRCIRCDRGCFGNLDQGRPIACTQRR